MFEGKRKKTCNLRAADPDDINAIQEIEALCFTGDLLSRRSIRSMICHPQNRMFVACVEGSVIGYILMLLHRRSKLARLYSLAVLPEYRGLGIARQLLECAENHAKMKEGIKLEIRKDNKAALHLYESLGYQPRRIICDYYQDGEDATEMVKRHATTRPESV